MNAKIKIILSRVFLGKYEKLGVRQYFRAYLVASIILTSFVIILSPGDSGDSVVSSQSTQKTKAASPSSPTAKATIKPKSEPTISFEESKYLKNGGFTTNEKKTIKLTSKLMKSYVYLYSGYVVGNENAAAVQFGCSKLEESYPVIQMISSQSA